MKVCSKCNTQKEYSEFYKAKAYKDGYRGQCITCLKKWSANHRVKPTIRKKAYESHKEWIKDTNNMSKLIDAINVCRNSKGSGVYIIHTEDGDYIGSSNTIQSRIYTHKCKTKQNNSCIAGTHKVVGWSILESCDPDSKLEREEYWIKKLNPELNKKYIN